MSTLFEEMVIGSLRAKNRFIRAAMYTGLATEDGYLTPELVSLYEEVAAGGVGSIITGYAHVVRDEQPNPRMLGIYDDSFIPDFRGLVDKVHAQGVKLILQIAYGGSASKLNPPSAHILGPSAVANPQTGIVPVEATEQDIGMLVCAFADASGRAVAAGFDGVEIHAAHGYLLSQFLNPLLNRRTDKYGGPIENRARIIVEVLEAVRKRVGATYPVLVKLNSSDGVEGGLTEEDSLTAANILAAHGASALEVSGVWRKCRIADFNRMPFFASYAKRLAHEVAVPVLLTGGNRSFSIMEELAQKDNIAGFGLCRPFIREPDLIKRWEQDREAVPHCISCSKCDFTPGRRCAFK